MLVSNPTNTITQVKYTRLSDSDISRLPSLNMTRCDFYQANNMNNSPIKIAKTSSNTRNKIFTALTFGLVGLYLAHRQNLFNPIRREAKKIIKSSAFKNKMMDFVKEVLPEPNTLTGARKTLTTCKDTTRKFLESIITDKNRPKPFIEATKNLINSNHNMSKLNKKVFRQIVDDTNYERLQRGFAVDTMDRLTGKIEKSLKQMKDCGQPYKDQTQNIITGIFESTNNSESIAYNTLQQSMLNRTSVQIENFIKDLM